MADKSWEDGVCLFGLYLIQAACAFYELSVCIQQLIVVRMVIAQNHARIYDVLVEINLCGFQRQPVVVRIASLYA